MTYDADRLGIQLWRVEFATTDLGWLTLSQIAWRLRQAFPGTRFPEASVSARLRELRTYGYQVERQYVRNGLFEYRVSKKEAA